VCKPRGDGLSSIGNLLDWTVHRVCIWLVALLTCAGNVLVFVYRLVRHNSSQSAHLLFVRNLCGTSCLESLGYTIVFLSGTSLILPCSLSGTSVLRPCSLSGTSVIRPCSLSGISVMCPCSTPVTPVLSICSWSGTSVVRLCTLSRTSVVCLCNLSSSSMVQPCSLSRRVTYGLVCCPKLLYYILIR